MPDDDSVFPIGGLSEASGVSPPTIRYYEEIGLIPPARRSAAGRRYYAREDVARLTFIRRCRDFGFGIEQVRLLSGLSTREDSDCAAVRDVAAAHLASVRRKMDELRRLDGQLDQFVRACDAACCGGPSRDCVVLAELSAS